MGVEVGSSIQLAAFSLAQHVANLLIAHIVCLKTNFFSYVRSDHNIDTAWIHSSPVVLKLLQTG